MNIVDKYIEYVLLKPYECEMLPHKALMHEAELILIKNNFKDKEGTVCDYFVYKGRYRLEGFMKRDDVIAFRRNNFDKKILIIDYASLNRFNQMQITDRIARYICEYKNITGEDFIYRKL